MKVGDLIKVKECSIEEEHHWDRDPCDCFFCNYESSRVGVVMEYHTHEITDDDEVENECWDVLFDCGIWQVYLSDIASGEIAVVSEAKNKNAGVAQW